jgi:hypothetical protein
VIVGGPAVVLVGVDLQRHVAAVLLREARRLGASCPVEFAQLVRELHHVVAVSAEGGNRVVTPMPDGPTMTVAEVAALTGEAPRTIRHRCQVGTIDAVKRGSQWVIPTTAQTRSAR